MGQKINPIGFRLGVNRTADSRWYADSADFGRLLLEDIKIRKFIKEKLKQAGVSRVVIERPHKKCRVTIHSARPGLIIGKKGADIEKLRKRLADLTGGDTSLNAPIRDDGEAGEWQDWLVDTSPNQEAVMAEHEELDHRRQALNGAIGVLNPRERRIFEARRLAEDPMTLEDLAAEFGVSRERVRQIEVRAFEKVQSAVKGTIARQEAEALEAAH